MRVTMEIRVLSPWMKYICFSCLSLSLSLPFFFYSHSHCTWILHVKPSSTNWLWIVSGVVWQPISHLRLRRNLLQIAYTGLKTLPCGISVLPFLSPSPPPLLCAQINTRSTMAHTYTHLALSLPPSSLSPSLPYRSACPRTWSWMPPAVLMTVAQMVLASTGRRWLVPWVTQLTPSMTPSWWLMTCSLATTHTGR